MFIVNATRMQKLFYKVIEIFVDDQTKKKIILSSKPDPSGLTEKFELD
jgi:hypothetical protein